MSTKLLNFKAWPNKHRVGVVNLKYHGLIMRCDVVLYMKKGVIETPHLWVRMPEVWFTPKQKTKFCQWVNKEKSDSFQKKILEQLYGDYGIDVNRALEIYDEYLKRFKN